MLVTYKLIEVDNLPYVICMSNAIYIKYCKLFCHFTRHFTSFVLIVFDPLSRDVLSFTTAT
jgi:hypothetical protein